MGVTEKGMECYRNVDNGGKRFQSRPSDTNASSYCSSRCRHCSQISCFQFNTGEFPFKW